MKKKVLLVVVLVLALALSLMACKKPDLGDFDNDGFEPNEMQVVSDMNSLELLKTTYDTWKKDNAYKLTCDFAFSAGSLAERTTYQETILNGNEFYDYFALFGTGVKADKQSHKFYTNGDSTKAIYVREKDKRITRTDDKKTINVDYNGLSAGDFNVEREQEYDSKIKTPQDHVDKMTKSIFSYNLEEKFLSDKHDKNVYTDGKDYYATVILGTTRSSVITDHPSVIESIESATGGKFKQFDADTKLIFKVVKVGDTYKLSNLTIKEAFTGLNMGIVKVSCVTNYSYSFMYDEESIKVPTL